MDKISVVVALAGIAWVIFARQATPAIAQNVVSDVSTNLPWYLNYNTTSPITAPYMTSAPSSSVGIQNSGDTCESCSLFGASFGSQY